MTSQLEVKNSFNYFYGNVVPDLVPYFVWNFDFCGYVAPNFGRFDAFIPDLFWFEFMRQMEH